MNHTARKLALGTLAGFSLLGAALAAGTFHLKFYINDKLVTPDAIIVDGKTYVPVQSLKAAGLNITANSSAVRLTLPAATAAGGANQMTAVEGCMGQTLFNGVWRLKVLDSKPGVVNGNPGWHLTVEMRNGTPRPQYLPSTGIANSDSGYSLATPDGNIGIWSTNYTLNDFADRDVPQAGMFTYTFKFWPKDKSVLTPPAKFLLRIDTKNVNKTNVPYSVPDPSFRVDLTCKK